ncbi:MAG TPA: YciI family protein [Solirubrobacteraceae bacterium]
MPQYMLLIYPPADLDRTSDDPALQLSRWQDFTESLQDAGLLVGHGRLSDVASATTVRVRDGETMIIDGPFAETKEYLAGYYLIECPDLDTALAQAARMPNVGFASIEVRPMMFPASTPPAQMGA